MSNFCGMTESSDNFGCPKTFQTLIMWMYHFESPDLEICNISFVWRNIRGKLPYTAVQESSEIFEEKYILQPLSMLLKTHQSKFTFMKREMGKNRKPT